MIALLTSSQLFLTRHHHSVVAAEPGELGWVLHTTTNGILRHGWLRRTCLSTRHTPYGITLAFTLARELAAALPQQCRVASLCLPSMEHNTVGWTTRCLTSAVLR